ncbi:MAG: transposase [Clostridia bacterium]|nr:transposase [Clostridia bacterium]
MEDNIKELTLLLLYLTSWKEKDIFENDCMRAWKGYDFDILNSLEEENLIGGSTHKAKSTYLTATGSNKAKELMKKYNIE